MKIIGYHTCSKKGDITEIEEKGAFYSEHIEEEPNNHKFLGSGYYFWDNNIGMAHSHGQNAYKRKYHIFKAELNLGEDAFLDLAGNRIDMLNFQEIINKLREANKEVENWTLAHFITFLQSKAKFPYRSIRAIDAGSHLKDADKLKFVDDRNNFTNLNPVFIVCLLDKEKDLVISFQHFKTFPQNG